MSVSNDIYNGLLINQITDHLPILVICNKSIARNVKKCIKM